MLALPSAQDVTIKNRTYRVKRKEDGSYLVDLHVRGYAKGKTRVDPFWRRVFADGPIGLAAIAEAKSKRPDWK